MSTPEQRAGEIQPPSVSIGRPLSAASLETFMAAFEFVMPPEVHLESRPAPGIKYVKTPQLSSILAGQNPPVPSEGIGSWVDELVASLCYSGNLNRETARRSIDVRISELRIQGIGPHSNSEVHIGLIDPQDAYYPCGQRLYGETKAINHRFGLELRSKGKKDRAHRTRANVGEVTGQMIPRPMMKEFSGLVGAFVTLDPIGLVVG